MAEELASVDFFISYNHEDRPWAEWIAWQLEHSGYSTVIDAWDFRPGANFVVEMQDALTKARRMVAVLSPRYLQSKFALAEWASAFADDPRGAARKLIPVRIEECQASGLLRQVVYIDLFGRDEDSAKRELISGLKLDRAKPSRAPTFPVSAGRASAPHFPAAQQPAAVHIEWPKSDDTYLWPLADRKLEFSTFKSMLSGEQRQRLLIVTGSSNSGKTRLLLELQNYAATLGVPSSRIDLRGCQGSDDVLQGLLDDLVPKESGSAAAFSDTRPLYGLIEDLRHRDRPSLLVFDSYEKASPSLSEWLEGQLLAKLVSALGAIVVVGGQQIPDHKKYSWGTFAQAVELSNIGDVADWRDLVARAWRDVGLTDEHIQGILAATGGKPGETYVVLHSLASQLRQRRLSPGTC